MTKKKNRLRHREFSLYTTLLGNPSFEAIMRDIVPDGTYEIESIGLTVNTSVGTGIVTYIAFGKNVDPKEPTIVAEELVAKHGIILHWEPHALNVAGTDSYDNFFYAFPTPLFFDENDKLNVQVRNSAAQPTTYVIDIAYRVLS